MAAEPGSLGTASIKYPSSGDGLLDESRLAGKFLGINPDPLPGQRLNCPGVGGEMPSVLIPESID